MRFSKILAMLHVKMQRQTELQKCTEFKLSDNHTTDVGLLQKSSFTADFVNEMFAAQCSALLHMQMTPKCLDL